MSNAKVTIKPSEEVVLQAAKPVVVHDHLGRAITLQKPGVLAQFRMIEMLGPEASQNQVFVSMVLPMMFITAIDGEPVPRPSTRRELDALIQRLDDGGVVAVSEGVMLNFGTPNAAKDEAALKN